MKQKSVYAIRSEAGPVKIGVSNNPAYRAKTLESTQAFRMEVEHIECCGDLNPFEVEQCAHTILWQKRLKGEWFDASPITAREAIRLAVESVTRANAFGASQNSENNYNSFKKLAEIDIDAINSSLGKKIYYFRRKKGVSRELLGSMIGVKMRQIGKIERGECCAKYIQLYMISIALDTPLMNFLPNSEASNKD